MPLDRSQTASAHRLTILYIVSLSTVAALSIVGQVLVQRMLNREAADAQVINAAEKQQLLSVELGKTAFAVSVSDTSAERQQNVAELRETIDQWETSRQTLHHLVVQGHLSHSKRLLIDTLLATLEPEAQTMLRSSRKLLSLGTPPPRGLPALPKGADLRQFRTAEHAFLKGLDTLILEYNEQAAIGITYLHRLELMLLGVTLLVLVLEGLWVFRPAAQKIHQTLVALAASLEQAQETARQLAIEQEQSERLLLNILPEAIAERLKLDERAIADGFNEVTVLFADIVGFTQLSSRLSPQHLVELLNQIFSRFDQLAEHHQLEKIKTIGDAYMVVGGLPELRSDHAVAIAQMALDMQQDITQFNSETGESFSMRIGINTGPVVAGVIGIKKFIYDLWGDTVNVASRMESHGLPGQIQVTEATFLHIQDQYECQQREAIQIKGKGEMMTYLLLGKKAA